MSWKIPIPAKFNTYKSEKARELLFEIIEDFMRDFG